MGIGERWRWFPSMHREEHNQAYGCVSLQDLPLLLEQHVRRWIGR